MGRSRLFPPGPGALLAGLLALTAGCAGEAPEEVPSEDAARGTAQQSLVPPKEKSCQELKTASPSAGDGEYTLYVEGDLARPWRVWCQDMATVPKEYLPLVESGLFSNFSQYTAGVAAPGTTVRTTFTKLRIDPATLRVSISDRTFATSTGSLSHPGRAPSVTSMPYGVAMSCDWTASGRATVDLRGTPFRVASEQFSTLGWSQLGASTYGFADEFVALTGGGYCGWTAPLSADPFTGGSLQLAYAGPAPRYTPVARLYRTGATEAEALRFQPGPYDSDKLHQTPGLFDELHVPRGWRAYFFAQAGFQGDTRTFEFDLVLPGDSPARSAGSLFVAANVVVYTSGGYTGTSQTLGAGRYDMGHLTVGNDTIRSIRVPDGFRVILFRDGGFRGTQLVLTQDTDLTGHPFAAQTSSIIVESTTTGDGNLVYGRWLSSGGKSTTSPDNRKLVVDYLGGPDIVTFDLESGTGTTVPYLYLLDANDQVLLEAAPSGPGDTHARISALLTTGTYKLVAATTQAGRTADFIVRSDKARLRYPQRLYIHPVTSIPWYYDNAGTGSHKDGSVWRPDLSGMPGAYALGDIAMRGHSTGPRMSFVVSGEGDVLARPTDYTLVWDDKGTHGQHDVSFWHPVPPAGYTCLGTVANRGYDKPALDLVRCVRSEYVLPAAGTWVWDDKGSGGSLDVTLYEVNPSDARTVNASLMVGQGNYDAPDPSRIWALNKSALANPELQGGAVDANTVHFFAPRVWLHSGEYYWPSSVEHFLDNVKREGNYLTTKEPLGCASCTDPQFLDGQRPDQQRVPVYAQVVTRTQGGVPTNVTDVIYWTFYPYNNGKRVCVGPLDPVAGCYGAYSTFGNHVGDWEHLTVRFVDGRPTELYMAQHSDGARFLFGDKAILLVAGLHPEVYAALGSHGLYPDAARHVYKTIILTGEKLADDTDRGIAWDTWNHRPVIFDWQPPGTFLVPLQWLNISASWGNAPEDCGNLVSKLSGECVLNGGPTPPLFKGFANPSSTQLE
ncbi:Vps62-related protein [Myxococcus stipitatus]|uniref:Vps62-related protein n=1 Tax=Myxococcus stipitatus TaxID=83455 RepID=UPI001F2C0672|nr:Vps62-related protein [Myxococcus stipitatus]MCE9669349.1 Vps62-related protein [Myxococcus stipitatus]